MQTVRVPALRSEYLELLDDEVHRNIQIKLLGAGHSKDTVKKSSEKRQPIKI